MAATERRVRATDKPAWSDAAEAMFRAAQVVTQPGGPAQFDTLVQALAGILQAAAVFVAVFSDESRQQMRTLAAVLDGKPLRNFDYPLEGSPCAQVVGDTFRYVARGVAAEFPPGTLFGAKGMDAYAAFPLNDGSGNPLGLLVAMDRRPIADESLAEALLKIFAGRIVAEIERGRADAALRSAALAVSSAHGETVFAELARYLATILHVEVAFIARHEPGADPDMRTMAVYCDGAWLPESRYPLQSSPCVHVLGQQFRAYPSRLGELFPDDEDARTLALESYAGFPLNDRQGRALGTLGVLSRRPLLQLDRIQSMLQIFAVRAAAELEQLRAHEALSRSEASYRAIFDSAEDAIFIHDWDTGEVLDVNPKACKTYGYSHDELCRLSVADISSGVPPYTAAQALAYIQLAKLDRCPPFEWHRRNRDGSLHWDEVRLKPVQIGGKPHVLAFTRDITAQKQALEALAANEAQYRAIFNASADALVLRDADFRIVEVNSTYETMSGFTRAEAIGLNRVLANPPEVAGRLAALHARALAGEPIALETQLVRRDGVCYELELRGVPILHRGEPHVLYIGRNIDERHQAEQRRAELERQLRQAQKMEAIGQLTGGIAHDFNNILTSVIGYLVLGQERAETLADAALVRQLGQAQLAAQRARDLIAQMMTFARRQRGERRVLPLAPLVRQATQLLRATLPSSILLDSNAVDAEPDEAIAPVQADAVQLEQVLFNLCINARDAIDGAGHIRVGLRRAAGGGRRCASCGLLVDSRPWVELSVADSGTGIAPEVQARMFEPFFSTKEVGRGSGMGLAMVHGIVHDHLGHVCIDTAAGRGTTFRILLPAAAEPASGPAPARPASGPAPGQLAGRVLLVEDEVMVGDFMAELLQGWGLQVVLMRDPLAAQSWLEKPANRVDLLITDQTMPRLTGLALARRAGELQPGLPVLLYTGQADAVDPMDLARFGVRALLRKPVDVDSLRSQLQRCLDSSTPGSGAGADDGEADARVTAPSAGAPVRPAAPARRPSARSSRVRARR